MKIVTKEKIDWYETLLKAEIGKAIRIEYDERNRARTAISTDLRKSHPEMQFFTKIVEEDGVKYLMVVRVK